MRHLWCDTRRWKRFHGHAAPGGTIESTRSQRTGRTRGGAVTILTSQRMPAWAQAPSRVLNHSPRVSDTTRARVLAAIEVLDYRPNPLARGLSRGRCQTLGVVVPFFTHASAVERLRGVVAALDASHYDLVLFNVESPCTATSTWLR